MIGLKFQQNSCPRTIKTGCAVLQGPTLSAQHSQDLANSSPTLILELETKEGTQNHVNFIHSLKLYPCFTQSIQAYGLNYLKVQLIREFI